MQIPSDVREALCIERRYPVRRVVSGIFGALNGSKHAKEKNAEDYDSNTNNNGAHSIFDYYGTINNLPEGTYKFENGKFIKTN